MDTLGERICFVRKKLGLTQAEFAVRIGFTRALTVSRYETNQREPEVSILVEIAKLGGVSLDWLLTGEDSPSVRDIVTEKILQLLDGMEEEKRREVLKYLEEKKLLDDLLKERKREGLHPFKGGAA